MRYIEPRILHPDSVSWIGKSNLGQKIVEYRLYFLDGSGCIFAREEFETRDDATALRVAAVIGESCSDAHSGYALWRQDRELYDTGKHSRGFARGLNAAPLALDVQEIVLDMERQLLDSHCAIARSRRLLAASCDLATITHKKAS